MNIVSILFLFFLQAPSAPFTAFTYCHEYARGLFEIQCVSVQPDGTGETRIKRRGADEFRAPMAFSQSGRERFLAVLAATEYLAKADSYESKKKVADLGQKRLVLETPGGRREARFNFSDLKEVTALAAFFDGVLNQEILISEMDAALRYERLSIPERLDRLEEELRANRIPDPPRLIPLLEKIEKDDRVMNFARSTAQGIRLRISAPPK